MSMKVHITRATIEQAMKAPKVRAALRAKADRIAARARVEAAGAGAPEAARNVAVTAGVRPGTKAGGFRRPYARVAITTTPEQRAKDAGARLTHKQILRRAGR